MDDSQNLLSTLTDQQQQDDDDSPGSTGDGQVELSRLVVKEPSDQEPTGGFLPDPVDMPVPHVLVSSWSHTVRRNRRAIVASAVALALFVFFVAFIVHGLESSAPRKALPALHMIIPNGSTPLPPRRSFDHAMRTADLYAVHDLVLVGYAAVFMTPDSTGQADVRSSAAKLSTLLPTLHPYPPCRGNFSALPAQSDELDAVAAVAQTAWSCLPAGFTGQDFSSVFDKEAVNDPSKQIAAKCTLHPLLTLS